ncbi:MAG: hypothetical protein ABEJ79_10680 [Halolamina sp.]
MTTDVSEGVPMGYAARYYPDIAGSLGFYVIVVGTLCSVFSATGATILSGSCVNPAIGLRDRLAKRFEAIRLGRDTTHRTAC